MRAGVVHGILQLSFRCNRWRVEGEVVKQCRLAKAVRPTTRHISVRAFLLDTEHVPQTTKPIVSGKGAVDPSSLRPLRGKNFGTGGLARRNCR